MNFSNAVDSPTPVAKPQGLILPGVLLAGALIFFGFPGLGGERLDLWFQGLFWRNQQWVIAHDEPWAHALAYTGPKVILIIVAVLLLIAAFVPQRFPAWLGRRRAVYLILCLGLVPAICSQLRVVTHMSTPLDLKLFGGKFEHLLLFQAKPAGYPSNAFPAAHASGGFSLLGLAWAWTHPRGRRLGWILALVAGTWMGGYQIARGEHFLSHTLVTVLLAWLITYLLALGIKPAHES